MCRTQDRYEIRDTRYGIRDTGYEIRDTRYGIRDTGYEIRDVGIFRSNFVASFGVNLVASFACHGKALRRRVFNPAERDRHFFSRFFH